MKGQMHVSEQNFFPKNQLHNPIKQVLKSQFLNELVSTSEFIKRKSCAGEKGETRPEGRFPIPSDTKFKTQKDKWRPAKAKNLQALYR